MPPSATDNQQQATDSDVLVKVDGVSKKFCRGLKRSLWYGLNDIAGELTGKPKPTDLRKDEFWAVRDVSFELKRGECLGLIGHNGAGKSTLLKMLNGLIKPDRGRIEMHGRVGALIELNAGFNPILTGRENIYNKGSILGFTKKHIDQKFDAIVEFAEIGDFLDMPVQNYSSGMKVRLGFAVSAQMEPDVLIIDEVLAVGDLGFRIKCLNTITEIMKNAAVIFVSHSMPMMSRISTQVLLIHHGRTEFQDADVARGIEQYFGRYATGKIKVSGSGAVKLQDICITSDFEQDGPSQIVQYGVPLGIRMSISTSRNVPRARVSCVIWNQELRPVATLVNEDAKPCVVDVPASGTFTYSMEIPKLHLNHGKHSLAVIVANPETNEVMTRVDNALEFVVRAPTMTWSDVIWPCETATIATHSNPLTCP